MFKGAIFDLDGVVVNTVPIHFKAWQRMFTEYGRKFTFKDYKEKVDGIPRIAGGKAILHGLSGEEIIEATNRKQLYFREYHDKDDIPVFRTTVELIKELKDKGIKVAVISSSKNSSYILNKTGIIDLIDTEINGGDTTKGKPDPQIFIMACERTGLRPGECVVFEDAVLGVEAAKRADMICIGIDRHGDPARLARADIVVEDLREIDYEKLKSLFRNHQ